MSRFIVSMTLWLAHNFVSAQILESVTSADWFPQAIEFDASDSLLYVGLVPCVADGPSVTGLATWDGNTWSPVPNTLDSAECATSWISSIVRNNGELFIGGNFDYVHDLGPNSAFLARRTNDEWFACGSPSSPVKLVKNNNEVWAVGGYAAIGTNGAGWLAKYVNNDWMPFGNSLASNHVRSVCYYNDDFIVAGNFTQTPTGQDILRWNGNDWEQIGTELIGGGFNRINTVASYNGHLFAGGALYVNEGNPGQHLVVWNGESWSGFFQDIVMCKNQVNDIQVINGKLYIAGVFQFIGDTHYYDLLQYDGMNLCAVGKDLTQNAGKYASQVRGNSNEVYFSTTNIAFAGDTVNYLAKWTLAVGADTCVSATIGIADLTNSNTDFTLNGNLLNEILSVTVNDPMLRKQKCSLILRDIQGRNVKTFSVTPLRNERHEYLIADLPEGFYTISLLDSYGNHRQTLKVVLE